MEELLQKVLNELKEEGDVLGDESSWIDEGIMREEVEQALGN